MIYLVAALVTAAAYGVHVWTYGTKLTPDGRFYVALGAGTRVPAPYCYRVLVPLVCRARLRVWRAVSALALVGTGPLLVAYLALLGVDAPLLGLALWLGLPGVFGLLVRYPVLVDQVANAAALGAAVLWWGGHPATALVVALVGGLVRETVPVWAAALALSPVLLCGLLAPLLLRLFVAPGPIPESARAWLEKPLEAARVHHLGSALDPAKMLAPWGALAVLFPLAAGAPGAGRLVLAAALALAVAYAQLFVANDATRLYQAPAPLVVAVGALLVPAYLAPLVAVAHLFNPWARVDT